MLNWFSTLFNRKQERLAGEPHTIPMYPQEEKFIIFLDIDGVLHRESSGSLEFMPNLQLICKTFPDLRIVISSNWKWTHTLEQLKTFFPDDIRPRILGATPDTNPDRRDLEIMDSLQEFFAPKFLALDDNAELFKTTNPKWLFLVPSNEGLNALHTQRLYHKIKGMMHV